MRRRGCAIAGGILALIVLVGLVAGIGWYRTALSPVGGEGEVVFEVPPGAGVNRIASLLSEEGLIRDEWAFRLLVLFEGMADGLQAGHYALSPAMSAKEIALKIQSGDVATFTVTVPEGLTIPQVAERVAATGLFDPEAFVAAAIPTTVAEEVAIPLPEGDLEGYLFPETYQFSYDADAPAVVTRMVRELQDRFYTPNREEIEERGLTLHELVTMASLIEREARVEQDRAMIAGVIQNRLDRGMRLQIDATVLYALGEHKDRVLYSDLEVESPYNTYRHAGLPPGPICSPGLASLEAALRPAETDALYYVARPDGSHIFSRTWDEHQQAIRQIRGE